MKTFFFSDPHFGHYNIIKYQDRPFQTTSEMDEAIIENWNHVVEPGDRVFLLGDVSLRRPESTKEILDRLHGKITLILGNHDRRSKMERMNRFELVSPHPILYEEFFLLSHKPVFLTEESPFCNVHGHIHRNRLKNPILYVNVSAECVDYTPVSFAAVKKIVRKRMGVAAKMQSFDVEE